MDDPSSAGNRGAALYTGLGATGSELPTEISRPRRVMALLFAALILAAVPMFWASSAVGDGADQPVAPLSGKSGTSGSDDENSGNGDDDEQGTDGAKNTLGTDGAGDTRGTLNTDRGVNTLAGSVSDGANNTLGTDGEGDTVGTKGTDVGENSVAGSATDGADNTLGTDGAGDTVGTKGTDAGDETDTGASLVTSGDDDTDR